MTKVEPLGAVPLGDCAVYVEFSKTLDMEVNSALQRLATMVHGRALPWIRDVVPALGGIAIHFDPDHKALTTDAMSSVFENSTYTAQSPSGTAPSGSTFAT